MWTSASSASTLSRPSSPTHHTLNGSPPLSNGIGGGSFIHHFRICPMKEAIDLKIGNQSIGSSRSLSRLLSQSTLSLRSCHVSSIHFHLYFNSTYTLIGNFIDKYKNWKYTSSVPLGWPVATECVSHMNEKVFVNRYLTVDCQVCCGICIFYYSYTFLVLLLSFANCCTGLWGPFQEQSQGRLFLPRTSIS